MVKFFRLEQPLNRIRAKKIHFPVGSDDIVVYVCVECSRGGDAAIGCSACGCEHTAVIWINLLAGWSLFGLSIGFILAALEESPKLQQYSDYIFDGVLSLDLPQRGIGPIIPGPLSIVETASLVHSGNSFLGWNRPLRSASLQMWSELWITYFLFLQRTPRALFHFSSAKP